MGLYYGEEIHGVPPVLLQMVLRTPVLYEVNIFVTNRFVPIPEVLESERLLVEQLGVSGFYHVIARSVQKVGNNTADSVLLGVVAQHYTSDRARLHFVPQVLGQICCNALMRSHKAAHGEFSGLAALSLYPDD